MDIDVRRNLIIGALDPRHDDVDQAKSPGIARSAQERETDCRSGFYVDLGQRPGEPPPGRQLRRSTCGPHRQLHRRLQVRVGGRPGAPRRPCLPRAIHPWWPRRRAADLGHRPPQPGEAEGVLRADRPLAQRWADRLLARRGRRRDGIAWTSGRGGCSVTRPRVSGAIHGLTRCGRRGRGIRSSSPAEGSRAGLTASPSRRPISSTTRHVRSTAKCARPASPTGTSSS